jgi:hypothetical protein
MGNVIGSDRFKIVAKNDTLSLMDYHFSQLQTLMLEYVNDEDLSSSELCESFNSLRVSQFFWDLHFEE